MDVAWVDKPDNPQMADWGLSSGDVYGGVVLINFHDRPYRSASTDDFVTWRPCET